MLGPWYTIRHTMIRKQLRRLAFNFWYYLQPPWDTRVTPPEVEVFANKHPPGRALDLGCGTGTNMIYLAERGWDTVGVDFAPKAIRAAQYRILHREYKSRFLVDDVTRLDKVVGLFDLILDMGCYHNLEEVEQDSYIKNLVRLLAPGGSYLLYVFFRPTGESPRPGVIETDLTRISKHFYINSRQDSFERETRPSAWLTFQNHQA